MEVDTAQTNRNKSRQNIEKYLGMLDQAIASLEVSQVSSPYLEVEEVLCDLLEIKINLRRLLIQPKS